MLTNILQSSVLTVAYFLHKEHISAWCIVPYDYKNKDFFIIVAPLYDTARRPANNEHSYDDLTQKTGEALQSPGTLGWRILQATMCLHALSMQYHFSLFLLS